MDAIIVIHGYEGAGELDTRIKEVAIVGICRSFIGHWIIERPQNYPTKEDYERTVAPLDDKDFHKLPWYEGTVSLEKLKREIARFGFEEYKVYTVNDKYSGFIEQITGIHPISLEDYEIPSIRALFKQYDELRHCFVHARIENNRRYADCALKVAHAYRKWIRQKCSPGDNIFIGETTYGQELYENLERKFKKQPHSRVPTDSFLLPGGRDEVG